MTMADADKMLEWKNYPETRKFAIVSHEEIKREDHLKWLEKNLKYFQIIDSSMDVMGAVRVQNNEVSIWVDRKYRGKGVAVWAVSRVSKPGMTAKIVEGNVASMRVFIKCGYLPIEHIDNYYIFQCES
jgi:RimJ/RimL family protein N-acetyltransferase